MPLIIEVQVKLPKIPNMSEIAKSVHAAMMQEAQERAKLYDQFFMTWDEKPIMAIRSAVNPRLIKVTIAPEGDEGLKRVIGWVVAGTAGPYPITPTGPWPLRFPETYTPKTQPGVIQSRTGGYSGQEVRTYGVEHPGIEARPIAATIAAKRGIPYAKAIGQALGRGLANAFRMGKTA